MVVFVKFIVVSCFVSQDEYFCGGLNFVYIAFEILLEAVCGLSELYGLYHVEQVILKRY